MANNRDDFTEKTKRTLQGRVGNRCSNPNCRCLTSGPNFHEEKVTTIGEAAHITAASQNGPRYDPSLDSSQRQHISNGIWLCATCSKLIDKDEKNYPIELLMSWKANAEALCHNELERAGQSNFEEDDEKKEGWGCGHCHTFVENGQTICTGCSAEVIYSLTNEETRNILTIGFFLGLFLDFILFKIIPSVINEMLDTNIPDGWGVGRFVICCGVIILVTALIYKLEVSKYKNQPPRFFRKRNL